MSSLLKSTVRRRSTESEDLCCPAGIGQYVAFFWQPTYYIEVYSGRLQNASLYSTLPWVASAIFTNVAGWAADALIARSALTLTGVRKLMEGLSCFGAAACLLVMAFLPQVEYQSADIHKSCSWATLMSHDCVVSCLSDSSSVMHDAAYQRLASMSGGCSVGAERLGGSWAVHRNAIVCRLPCQRGGMSAP